MNRNTESHFAELPTVKIGRSKFDRSFTHKTTFNTGELVPVYVDPDIVPGDTVTMRQAELVRMMTPLTPVMDNAFMDFYWFFVPNRLVWDDFKKFMGENDTAPWTQTIEYQVPQIEISNYKNINNDGEELIEKGSLLNHLGIPITPWEPESPQTKTIQVSQLPTRAYCLVWNSFFRDENLQNPVNIRKDSTRVTAKNTKWTQYIANKEAKIITSTQNGGLPCLKVAKPHDYFTSALPEAQKGPAVALPLSGEPLKIEYGQQLTQPAVGQTAPVWTDGGVTGTEVLIQGTPQGGGVIETFTKAEVAATNEGQTPVAVDQVAGYSLIADLTKATGATVTALRQAFAIQKFYERDARGGTRYIESVKSHFGVTNPDFRLQRPEYLGGFRQNINMNQIVQTAPLEEATTPLGTTGAFSVTSHENSDVFTHSFTEHGILLGLCCVRTNHTYQQGINRAWFKKKRLDFYSPEFANLSEQAILNQEIYVQGTDEDKEAFGYQEAWAEMRYMPDMVTGELSSLYAQTLDSWHYADYYEEKPTLGDKWIQETDVNMARTLAVQDHDQFLGDFYFGAIYTRPMPLYSIPGLIDHH